MVEPTGAIWAAKLFGRTSVNPVLVVDPAIRSELLIPSSMVFAVSIGLLTSWTE